MGGLACGRSTPELDTDSEMNQIRKKRNPRLRCTRAGRLTPGPRRRGQGGGVMGREEDAAPHTRLYIHMHTHKYR